MCHALNVAPFSYATQELAYCTRCPDASLMLRPSMCGSTLNYSRVPCRSWASLKIKLQKHGKNMVALVILSFYIFLYFSRDLGDLDIQGTLPIFTYFLFFCVKLEIQGATSDERATNERRTSDERATNARRTRDERATYERRAREEREANERRTCDERASNERRTSDEGGTNE